MLEWYVYAENINMKSIEVINVFDHCYVVEDIGKSFKKNKDDLAAIEKDIRNSLAYYYWSKCEWEVIISSWPPCKNNFKDRKIDVYQQVRLNWKPFLQYVFDNKKEFIRQANKFSKERRERRKLYNA